MVITHETIKRIAYDVKFIKKNSLVNNNIYYKHDENNILKGYALIIGNSDTPYAYGYYFFEFSFPENYPYEPPNVKFISNDGKMRFNPNLYIDGKVCLSVLNTWNGEGWTSCQNIHSILITLSSILNENPLLNEPGINKTDININIYNLLICYKNIEFTIIKQLQLLNNIDINSTDKNETKNGRFNNTLLNFIPFKEIMLEKLKINGDKILNKLNDLENIINNSYKNNNIYVSIYNLRFTLDFINIKNNILNIIKN